MNDVEQLIAEARGFAEGSDSARATLLRDLAEALEFVTRERDSLASDAKEWEESGAPRWVEAKDEALRKAWRERDWHREQEAGLRDDILNLERELRDAHAEAREERNRATAAIKEMHHRELHHFEEEEKLAAALAVIEWASDVLADDQSSDLFGRAQHAANVLSQSPTDALAVRDRRVKAEALRGFRKTLAQGWRFDYDRLWKPAEMQAWLDYLDTEADRIEKEADDE